MALCLSLTAPTTLFTISNLTQTSQHMVTSQIFRPCPLSHSYSFNNTRIWPIPTDIKNTTISSTQTIHKAQPMLLNPPSQY